jgi:hypothetical protein
MVLGTITYIDHFEILLDNCSYGLGIPWTEPNEEMKAVTFW